MQKFGAAKNASARSRNRNGIKNGMETGAGGRGAAGQGIVGQPER